jgi:hypothetical protein
VLLGSLEWFEGVESYCVGVEKHHTSGRYHLHAYIKFLEARGILSVRLDVESQFPEGTINIQACRSKRNWCKYVSKEDDDTYFNVAESFSSFRTKAYRLPSSTGFHTNTITQPQPQKP